MAVGDAAMIKSAGGANYRNPMKENAWIENAHEKPFKKISDRFFLEGEIDPKKAKKAAELSFEKYCSVSKTLDPNVTVNYEVFVNGDLVKL